MVQFKICGISCLTAIAFVVAMIYFYSATYTDKVTQKYLSSLTPEQRTYFQRVVNERSRLSYQGYALGAALVAIYLVYQYFYANAKAMSATNMTNICVIVVTVAFTNYFYYILSPKQHSMLNIIKDEKSIKNWYSMYRNMQFNYHTGMLFGIAAAGMLGWALRC